MELSNVDIEDCSTHFCVVCGYITLIQNTHDKSHQITENNENMKAFRRIASDYFNSKYQFIILERVLHQINAIIDNECSLLMYNSIAIEHFTSIISPQNATTSAINKYQASKLYFIIRESIHKIIEREVATLCKSVNENGDKMKKYILKFEKFQFHNELIFYASEKSKNILFAFSDKLNKFVPNSAYLSDQLQHFYGTLYREKYADFLPLIANLVFSKVQLPQKSFESFDELGGFEGIYTGDYLNKKKHGKGKMVFFNKITYDGEWKDDIFWGKGLVTSENYVYYGDFVNGTKDGIGWDETNNKLYIGEWKCNRKEGWGFYLHSYKKHPQIANQLKNMSIAELKEEIKKYHYSPTIEFIYGTFKDDISQGPAQVQFTGILYEGVFGHDKFFGNVVATDGKMMRYEGGLEKGKNGHGILISFFEYYIGNYLLNKKDGKGVFHNRTLKTIYIGSFKEDLHDGDGLLIKNNEILGPQVCDHLEMEECLNDIVKEGVNLFAINGAEICYGEWKNGILNGKGFIRYADNTFYIGQISDEKRHSNGVYLMPDTILEGYFNLNLFVKGVRINMPYNIIEFATAFATHNRDRLPIINGSISYSNGSTYEGEIKGTIKHGVGTLRLSNDEVCKGTWKYNVMDGDGEIVLPDGTTYKGQFVNGKKHGKGVLKSCTGASYDGEWRDDRCDGIGKLVLKNGDIFEGKVKDFMPNGEGTFTTDGSK